MLVAVQPGVACLDDPAAGVPAAGSTHSWLNRNRGILIHWCKKDANHLALLQLARGLIAFKKACCAPLATQPVEALSQTCRQGTRNIRGPPEGGPLRGHWPGLC